MTNNSIKWKIESLTLPMVKNGSYGAFGSFLTHNNMKVNFVVKNPNKRVGELFDGIVIHNVTAEFILKDINAKWDPDGRKWIRQDTTNFQPRLVIYDYEIEVLEENAESLATLEELDWTK